MFRASASASSPATAAAVFAAPPPSLRAVRRAVRVGAGQGLIVGLLFAIAGAAAASEAGFPQPNLFFLGLLLAWGWAALGALSARGLVAIPAVRRALGDDGLARASFVVPAVALALAGPLTLQALVAFVPVLCGANFDAWAAFAAVGTVHVHLAFAVAMAVLAWRVASGASSARVALWPTVMLSLMPGALILFPPVLVWVTGLALSRGFASVARKWFLDDQAA